MLPTAWAVPCDSILRRSRSLAMTKPTVSCAAVTARLTSCRKKFDHLWRRRPQLTMRIPIAPGVSLLLVAVTAFLASHVYAGPHPPDRISIAVNEQARRVDV